MHVWPLEPGSAATRFDYCMYAITPAGLPDPGYVYSSGTQVVRMSSFTETRNWTRSCRIMTGEQRCNLLSRVAAACGLGLCRY